MTCAEDVHRALIEALEAEEEDSGNYINFHPPLENGEGGYWYVDARLNLERMSKAIAKRLNRIV